MKMNNLLPKRVQNSNKGTFGTVLNVSGSTTYSGAGILSSAGALKTGAGKVVLCSTQNTLNSASYIIPELVLTERKDISFKNISSVILGCGLGQTDDDVKIFETVLQKSNDIPLVIDADGLNILAKGTYLLPKNTILTPHPLEMARLINVDVEKILNKPELAIQKCVEKYSSTVILKMHKTHVMNLDGEVYINNTGNSALAKAGSGDVLAGMIGGLLAQGMNCYDASRLGVYLHGLAGEIASEELSEYSVLASDLLKYIGYAFKKIK